MRQLLTDERTALPRGHNTASPAGLKVPPLGPKWDRWAKKLGCASDPPVCSLLVWVDRMRTRIFSPTYPTRALVGGTSRSAGDTVFSKQADPGIEKGVCRTHDWCTAEDGETQGYCIEELSRRVQASPRARTAGGASSCTTARCAAAPGLATPGPPAAPPTTGAPAASGPRPGQ